MLYLKKYSYFFYRGKDMSEVQENNKEMPPLVEQEENPEDKKNSKENAITNNKNENDSDNLKKSESRDNLFIAVTAVLAGVFFVFIIYQIVTSPEQLLPLLSCGVAFIVDIFLMIFSIQRKFEVQRMIEKRHFDEMFAAQKASYFVLRRSFDDLEERLNSLEFGGSSISGDDIVSAQKALTKVTINKNSQNTRALSQEQKKLLNDAKDEMLQSNTEQKKTINDARDELLQSNQELRYMISDISTELKSLKADIQQLEAGQNAIPISSSQGMVPEESVQELQADTAKEEKPIQETPAEPSVDLSDPNRTLSADEIAKLFASMS